MSDALPGGARLVELPEFADARGSIVIAELGRGLPFLVRRVRWIHSVAAGAMRGGHGHRETEQLFVAVAGGATVALDDGRAEGRAALDRPGVGLYVPPMVWVELHDFAPGTVVVLLSSTVFAESDYVRDRALLGAPAP